MIFVFICLKNIPDMVELMCNLVGVDWEKVNCWTFFPEYLLDL